MHANILKHTKGYQHTQKYLNMYVYQNKTRQKYHRIPQHITIFIYIPLHDSTSVNIHKMTLIYKTIPIITHSYPIIPTDLMFYIYIHETNNPAIKKLLPFELIYAVKLE